MNVITPMEIYWITRLDAICGLFVAMNIIGGAFVFVAIIALFITEGEVNLFKHKMYMALVFILLLIGIFGVVFTPTTKEFAMIRFVPAIVNNKTVQGEASDLYKLAKQGLKELVNEKEEK